ncbi:MAG: response regulator transcription factor, partial [Planctomycetia bacterium]
MRLLVIENGTRPAAALRQSLVEQGHGVDPADGVQVGEDLALTEPYDAILLDAPVGDVDEPAFCRRLRSLGVTAPVVVLSPKSRTEDKVAALDAGADEYLVKPFDSTELLARLRALWRRGTAQQSAVLAFMDLRLDLIARRATRDGRRVKLTAKEFAILEFLLRHPDRVLTRTAIGEHVWDMNFDRD